MEDVLGEAYVHGSVNSIRFQDNAFFLYWIKLHNTFI